MVRKEDREAILITQAELPQDAQHRARVRRYLFLMAFRVPALVLAGVLYGVTGNGYVALGVIALSIPLPWMAVLIANDRPPRAKGEARHYKFGGAKVGNELGMGRSSVVDEHPHTTHIDQELRRIEGRQE
ncbi:DUF3099 domain-containing protein [Williamsia sterculiae]|uniref:DUF3099 domain-containing protein n=1 Tax=Williamsia sterculiae TaxID=1344003 RepID=A0A1N7EFC5_9NOCA|nr:DUF3099 domain-containing protein [Williamsia sterculiae]SIR86595.1 Protein of unknown function [Williamsia sterculiae]